MILLKAVFMGAVINIAKTKITFSELSCYLWAEWNFQKQLRDAAGENLCYSHHGKS